MGFYPSQNCRIDYLRRNSRFRSDIDPTDIFDSIEDKSPGPFTQVHTSRIEAGVHSGLQALPREQTEILTKVYLEGKTHKQTSEDLKLPLGTVKSRVRLALRKLESVVKR